ncbi:SMI1/KNR4 family protein [Streptomyces mashuensis]|uniref:SMI1/KNR4 family protein n=1 Tax=Streptomyces mashuensis TaxID=33904 RepID=A0A919EDF5_9ACTN|nr:SMI1/KNR4 family protein [Streptomyces mashuensis]GHF44583.1 SMI1/KNR4 family protein [Streptomyces mashuensis]
MTDTNAETGTRAGERPDVVARVAVRARADRGDALRAPVSARELAAVEAELGLALPPLLARLYREVGNGGYGPGYQLLPLTGDGRTLVSAYRDELSDAACTDDPHWPAGVLPLLDWGCGMYAAVDCHSATGTVLLYEPNDAHDDWADAWYVDAGSLEEWLETWLAGKGWYEEDAYEAPGEEGPQEPCPWTEAKARLAGAEPGR